jgi:8-oxo-dGTP pyrophosphatase MutT (NUDIX family)
MIKPRQKVQCYITREHAGSMQVLVFEHLDYPSAGIQVPAGSIEQGEAPEQAALREAWEESGVQGLRVQRYLGNFRWRHVERDEDHERHVFHLEAPQPLPERWEHTVSAGTEDKGLRFSYYWLDQTIAARVLSGNQGEYLKYLDKRG